jgi:RHS repeat-associated protein
MTKSTPRWAHIRTLALALTLGAFTAVAPSLAQTNGDPIVLSPRTGPVESQPGVTSITLTGARYPSGKINPAQVQITLAPASAGIGTTASFPASAIATLFGTSRRLTFTIPTSINVVSPTAYHVSIAGQTTAGIHFSSSGFSFLTVDPPAQINSISPNTASAGQSVTVALLGKYTTFTQGSTVASFGPGVAVGGAAPGAAGPVTVKDQSTAIAQLRVDPAAVSGTRNVTVQTGIQTATSIAGFTVTAGTGPQLSSVTPNVGTPGQQTLAVTIAGQNTHFDQTTTALDLGPGVSVVSIAVTDSTHLSAVITIDVAAVGGPRTVTATTGTETAALVNGFTVGPPPAVILMMFPNLASQGQSTITVTVVGKKTHFTSASLLDLGSGITASNVVAIDSTHLSADIAIATTASPGSRTIKVMTGGEIARSQLLASDIVGNTVVAFDSTTGALLGDFASGGGLREPLAMRYDNAGNLYVADYRSGNILKYDGSSGSFLGVFANARGQVGQGMDFGLDGNLYAGVNDQGVSIFQGSDGSFIGSLPYGAADPPELGNTWTFTWGLTLGPDGNLYVSRSSSLGYPGAVIDRFDGSSHAFIDTFAPFGSGGDFSLGQIDFGPDGNLYVADFSLSQGVTPATPAVVRRFNGATGAPMGAFVSVGTAAMTYAEGISFDDNSLFVTTAGSTNPAAGDSGDLIHRFDATTGQYLGAFGPGRPASFWNLGLPRFRVVSLSVSIPQLTAISPTGGAQGQLEPVTITGKNTHFTPEATTLDVGAGVGVSAVTVNSPTSLTAMLAINATAPVGARTVTVITGSEAVALANGFSVQAAQPLTVTPDTGVQSQTLTVTIVGTGTHFSQGSTKARFGPGVMVGNGIAGNFGPVTVVNSTTATAQLTILRTAMPAPRTINVQTGSELISSSNAFAVIGSPTLFSASPSQASQGQTVDVTVNGAYTHFAQGTTQASFGAGISVGGGAPGALGPVTVISATSFSAHLVVSATAALGLRTILAQTGSEQASTSLNFSVLGPITGPSPQTSITSLAEGTDVTAPTVVTGTVTSPNLDYWTLDYQAPTSTTFTPFATGTSAAVTGTFDPTLLLNGNAVIRLTAVDTSGQTSTSSVTVVVTRNLKIGNFTVSFNDLSVPVAGLPIQVIRTYDSRFKGVGDFGVGWRLDLNAVQIAENVALGAQWTGTATGIIKNYCVQEATTHKLTISLTDGTTYEFSPTLTGSCQQIVPPSQVSIGFTPTGITPPNVSLAIAGNNVATIEGPFPGGLTLFDLDNGTVFDPDQYVLTLPDGRRLQLSLSTGLQKMTDLNGNTLTVSPSGITSSTGMSVAFQRDSQNRIQSITDPNSNVLHYAYDGNGDLTSFTDPSNETSTYTYDSNHDLLTIEDPRHVQQIRNDYDANGRLVSHTDAYGNVINYTNDPNTSQETVTDRLGNTTVNEYDSTGNIVKVTDALGGITKRTYDANGNVTSETNALGYTSSYAYDANNNKIKSVDPLNNETDYVYNSRNQMTQITDPLKNVTTNVYDVNGNLRSTKDPAGNSTGYTYTAAGLMASMTDPLNNVTQYQYDGSGNLLQKTDPLHHVTAYTYDNNGNKTRETTSRTTGGTQETLTTGYQYDASNRLTQTTYPDNSTTQSQYNEIGKQSATIDQLHRQTTYEYDLMGRLTQTSYPDGTSESSTYDAEGDRISSTDRAQRTTTFVYDPLKRLTKTLYPDQATAQTGYDAIGEVTTATDALGNATQYKYDPAGHRTQVIDALMHATAFAYDATGNQTSMTDANNHATQYAYDALNRRTKVIYADNTTDLTAYDSLGRTVSKTDQASLATQYQYDALGTLIQVTDALSQATTYAYDEVGNRISQTDANSHTTTFACDKLNRRIQRTLPAGQTESMTYDAAGNLKTKTDFNGKTTTYNYDFNNRLTAKIPDASFSAPTVTFTYTATGQRESMTDTSGITSYTYDARDRLTKKATPEGTLAYSYDLDGNLKSIRSSNPNGTSVDYSYDADNRLSNAKDNRLDSGTTTYSYDNAGNLQNYLYPNGVQTTHQYNNLNRLTNLTTTSGTPTPIANYAYQLGPAGNRTRVNELGGRQVQYGYDDLYRLTSETITSDVNGHNGIIGYQYDLVGNRLSSTSSVGAVAPAAYSYDANDRLSSDTYDANGSTTASNGNTYGYDSETHLVALNGGASSIVCDGDGIRVAKTTNGLTTQYLVDDRNLTGYAQVLEELSGGAVQRVYTYGLNRISQSQTSGTSFYGYDGHGNVRLLTDATGAVTDRYHYDAFGIVISQTGTTPNFYLYSGEQVDPSVGFYYLRSRYYKADGGRFVTLDSWFGKVFEPSTLHKYAYVANNPVNLVDPSGKEFSLPDLALTGTIIGILNTTYVALNERASGHSLDTVKGKLFSAFVFGFAAGSSAYGLVSYTGAAFSALVATLGTYGAAGLADPSIDTAIADTIAAGRWAHAASDLVNEGILATEADLVPIVHQVLSNPQATRAIKLGADQATAYAAQVNIGGFAYWVAVSVFNSGTLAGQIGSAVLPTLSQLQKALPPGIFF